MLLVADSKRENPPVACLGRARVRQPAGYHFSLLTCSFQEYVPYQTQNTPKVAAQANLFFRRNARFPTLVRDARHLGRHQSRKPWIFPQTGELRVFVDVANILVALLQRLPQVL